MKAFPGTAAASASSSRAAGHLVSVGEAQIGVLTAVQIA
jgi:hypothetical protein